MHSSHNLIFLIELFVFDVLIFISPLTFLHCSSRLIIRTQCWINNRQLNGGYKTNRNTKKWWNNMNTKNNQRTGLSKLLFKNALMDLLKEKGSVAKISVRELCDRAELNRSTFYAHYNEPNDLLMEIETELLNATIHNSVCK